MNFNPKVSIVIPVYNGSRYLAESINSALGQTYDNKEVIVVNDGSNDDGKTEAIARLFGNRIRYFSKPNGGVASALNFAIKQMEGEYLSWLSHDDLYYPEKIEKQIQMLDLLSNKQTIIFSDFSVIDEHTRHLKYQRVYFKSEQNMTLNLICYPQLHGCSTLVAKTCFDRIGGFNEKLHHMQDYEFWIRASRTFKFYHIPQFLIKSRVHTGQCSNAHRQVRNTERSAFYINIIERDILHSKKVYREIPELFFNMVRLKDPVVMQYLAKATLKLLKQESNFLNRMKAIKTLILSSLKSSISLPYVLIDYKLKQKFFTLRSLISYHMKKLPYLPTTIRDRI